MGMKREKAIDKWDLTQYDVSTPNPCAKRKPKQYHIHLDHDITKPVDEVSSNIRDAFGSFTLQLLTFLFW